MPATKEMAQSLDHPRGKLWRRNFPMLTVTGLKQTLRAKLRRTTQTTAPRICPRPKWPPLSMATSTRTTCHQFSSSQTSTLRSSPRTFQLRLQLRESSKRLWLHLSLDTMPSSTMTKSTRKNKLSLTSIWQDCLLTALWTK